VHFPNLSSRSESARIVIDWEADVVSVQAWAFRDDAGRPMTERTWDISLGCGKGGLRFEVSALDLSDLLRDSGIHEPGDLAYARFGGRPPGELRVLGSWRRITIEEWRLEPLPDGGALLELLGARRFRVVRLSGQSWRQLCSFAVAAVEHPWFEALRTP
jgi:hypothetical protein